MVMFKMTQYVHLRLTGKDADYVSNIEDFDEANMQLHSRLTAKHSV